jgi:hypothetical protein
MQCGKYRGRTVVDVAGIATRKLERKERKLKERGEDPSAAAQEDEKTETPEALDAQKLSKK